MNKNDKVIISDSDSIWDGYSAIVAENPDNDTVLVKINFILPDKSVKTIVQEVPVDKIKIEDETNMLNEAKNNEKIKIADDYIKKYVLRQTIDGDFVPSWIFEETIESATGKESWMIEEDAKKLGYKQYTISSPQGDYYRRIIADKDITKDDICDEFARFLLGKVNVQEVDSE